MSWNVWWRTSTEKYGTEWRNNSNQERLRFRNGAAPDIDCWIDTAGAESILDSFMQHGKIVSRFVSVAVNNKPRQLDLLHMTYAQKTIIGSGGYFPDYFVIREARK